MSPRDVYGKKYTVSGLAPQAGFAKGHAIDPEREKLMAAAFGRLSFANSRRWLGFLLQILPELKEKKGLYPKKLSTWKEPC